MAIWQVPIFLVNQDDIFGYSETNLLKCLSKLEKILPEEKSWCNSIRQYGKLESTCIEIDTDEGEILVRIDLRNITKKQLETIIEFADSNELKIIYKNEMYEPTIINFVKIFRESDAYRFIKDPEEYFKIITAEN